MSWRAWKARGVETRSVIERIVWSKPLSEAIVWIKRSVVMKTGASVGFKKDLVQEKSEEVADQAQGIA